eukprot:CAMPEP_0116896686 /NCGR_PEP_ID=MMETSP0467-20121206/5867_1 /TAXON_ID=283647 /ORGANISM="Mesodinium pulex, Strain SPMC105" /LENGTH=61 /DNA_ID=CAMNT_0004567979 /DNA_START=391 /DNA_END=576 /DNA_ORIENTATION=+
MGTFLVSKECFNQTFKQQKRGTIINISATIQDSGNLMTGHANAAKSGVDALTRTMAVEFGP